MGLRGDFNEEPCGKPQGINSHITNTAAVTLWQATGNSQVKPQINTDYTDGKLQTQKDF